VRVTREHMRSAFVSTSGEVLISPPCFQATRPEGAWTRTERAERGAVSRRDDSRLEETAAAAGAALAHAGYFGPFGIDAYRHALPGRGGAHDVLTHLSEINARLTLDWVTGIGARSEVIATLTL